jgi:hypothetical protein
VAKFEAFVQPGIVRLWLTEDEENGPWVEVKAEIGDREQRRIDSALLRGAQQVPTEDAEAGVVEIKLDGAEVAGVKLRTYLTDWSFTDKEGKPVKLNANSIAALKPRVADKILEKLNKRLDVLAVEQASDPFGNGSKQKSE